MSASGFGDYFIRADAEFAQEALAGAGILSVLEADDDRGSLPSVLSGGPNALADRANLNGNAPIS